MNIIPAEELELKNVHALINSIARVFTQSMTDYMDLKAEDPKSLIPYVCDHEVPLMHHAAYTLNLVYDQLNEMFEPAGYNLTLKYYGTNVYAHFILEITGA